MKKVVTTTMTKKYAETMPTVIPLKARQFFFGNSVKRRYIVGTFFCLLVYIHKLGETYMCGAHFAHPMKDAVTCLNIITKDTNEAKALN